jgi:hypothetical protein
MRKNSRISNPGTKMSPLEADKSSNFRSLFAAYYLRSIPLRLVRPLSRHNKKSLLSRWRK